MYSLADIKSAGTGNLYNLNGKKSVSQKETTASIFNFADYKKTEKLKPEHKTLYEDLKFEKAEKISDAKRFAHKNFGIKSFKVDDIAIANWINEGLTNLKNLTKGRATMPSSVSYESLGSKTKVADTTLKKNELRINKDFMENVDDWMANRLEWLKGEGAVQKNGKHYSSKPINIIGADKNKSNEVFKEFINVVNNSNHFSPVEKLSAIYKLDNIISKANAAEVHPEFYIEKLSKEYKFNNKIKNMVNTYSVLNETQRIRLAKFMLKAADSYEKKNGSDGYKLKAGLKNDTEFSVIYHELGHIAHKKEVSYEKFLDLRKPDIKYGKTPTPALDFALDKDKIHTASLISEYAAASPIEFVAETFAAMCENKEDLPKEVIELYKSYGGPMIID